MPQRPRAHILEDESWEALYNAAPTHWVIRKSHPDYGIDGEIEIFDDSGTATGLIFYFQLKATDLKDKKKALTYRFKKDTIIYYKSFQVPVLLIRYISVTKELYYRWASSVDFYYSKSESKTINVKFEEDSKWSQDTCGELINCLNVFQSLLRPQLKTPLTFHLNCSESEYCRIPKGVLVSAIKEVFDLEPFVELSLRSASPSSLVISLNRNDMLISLAGLDGAYLHFKSDQYFRKDNIGKIAYDVMVGIALSLYPLGHSYMPAEIAFKYLRRSTFIDNPDVLRIISRIFFKSGKTKYAIELAEFVMQKYQDSDLYSIFLIPILLRNDLTDSVNDSINRLFQIKLEEALKTNDKRSIAIIHYNLGNFYKTKIDDRKSLIKAFSHYHISSKFDQVYKKYDYFWAELGQITNNLGRYKCAEKFYAKAIGLGDNLKFLAFRADSLLFAGEYGKSYKVFTEYLKKADKPHPEWIIKTIFLKFLMSTLKKTRQHRNIKAAREYANIKGVKLNHQEEHLKKAIECDGLCSNAWFNLGLLLNSQNDAKSAALSFLFSGVINRDDVESLSNATLLMLTSMKEPGIISHTISFAYNQCGEKYTKELIRMINEQPSKNISDDQKIEFINKVVKLINMTKKQKDDYPIVRLHSSSEKSYTIIRLESDGNIIFETESIHK